MERDAGTREGAVDWERLGEDVPLLEGIRTTRAIRRLRPDPVPLVLIRRVCEAGSYAPSGGNRQPWVFVAVTDPERKAFVAEHYRKAFQSYIAPALEAARDPGFPDSQRRTIRSACHLAERLHEVPVQLFVAGRLRRGEPQPQSIFPAIQNVLLACRAVGLGASLTTLHTAYRDEIDAELGLPEKVISMALLPIGWPRGRYGRPPRRPIEEYLFLDRYGEPFPG